MQPIKKILRKIKRMMQVFFGSKTDEIFWRFRHVFDRKWAESYISQESINDPRRKFLIGKISETPFLKSILEIGCAAGPNLYLLAKKFPEAEIYGIDISRSAINKGKKHFEKENIKNVFLKAGGIEALKDYKDKSMDIVFTDAVLIYFDDKKILQVLKEMFRIAKKRIILIEMHHYLPASEYKDNWIHNYGLLFEKFIPKEQVKITKLSESIRSKNWQEYGYIIEATI